MRSGRASIRRPGGSDQIAPAKSALAALRAHLDAPAIVLERADRPVRLDDRPGVLPVIARDRRAAAAPEGDVEILNRGLADGKDPVAGAALRLDLLLDRRAALADRAFEDVALLAHAVRRAAEQAQAGGVFFWLSRRLEVAVAAHPGAADRDGRDRVFGRRGGGAAGAAEELGPRVERASGHGGARVGLLPGVRRATAARGGERPEDEQRSPRSFDGSRGQGAHERRYAKDPVARGRGETARRART